MPSKMSLVRGLLLAIILVSPLCLLKAQAPAPKLDDPVIEQRITQLLGQMTLEAVSYTHLVSPFLRSLSSQFLRSSLLLQPRTKIRRMWPTPPR